MGGPTGEAYVSTLNATGLSKEDTLARESIQNSSDSPASPESKVRVRFRRTVLQGQALRNFLSTLRLKSLHDRRKKLGLVDDTILDNYDDEDARLPLVYVEDFGTCGLLGEPHDPSSHFYRLLLSLGDSAKSRESHGSGGSYGFGKAAYFLNSRLHTIVAHSVFSDEDDALIERIFGCGFFQRHLVKDESFTGRAWFGIQRQKNSKNPIVDPVIGSDASEIAAALGFTLRSSRSDQGTSVMIVDANLDLDALLSGIETWWWPRLLEHDIDVSILDEVTEKESFPRPKKRDDLKPFMDAYQVALGRVEPMRPHQKREDFYKSEHLSAGDLGLVMLTPEQESSLDETRRNSIALIRAPRMVISYYPVSSVSPPVVGSFVGHSDVEKFLKLSEPPAHNLWDHNADRLARDGGKGARHVKSITDRIRKKARDFQNSASPPAPPRPNRLQRLERALGRYFMTRDNRRTQEGPEETPVHLVFHTEPVAKPLDDGMLEMSCKFEIRLKEEGPEEMRLRLKVNCSILENEDHAGDALPMQIMVEGVDAEVNTEDSTVFDFTLSKTSKARIAIKSSSYDPNWSLRFRPEVTPL